MCKIYLASVYTGKIRALPPCVPEMNILESFWWLRKIKISKLQYRSFMLDSGGFTALVNPSVEIDWDKYVAEYIEYIVEHNIELFFELDIDVVIGRDKVRQIRERIERETQRQPIWILQAGRTLRDLEEALERYKYIAIPLAGKVFVTKTWRNMSAQLRAIVDFAHERGAKVHALGYTPNRIKRLLRLGFDSADSSTWLQAAVHKIKIAFRNGRLVRKVLHIRPDERIEDYGLKQHNLCEWKKFCDYIEGISNGNRKDFHVSLGASVT